MHLHILTKYNVISCSSFPSTKCSLNHCHVPITVLSTGAAIVNKVDKIPFCSLHPNKRKKSSQKATKQKYIILWIKKKASSGEVKSLG